MGTVPVFGAADFFAVLEAFLGTVGFVCFLFGEVGFLSAFLPAFDALFFVTVRRFSGRFFAFLAGFFFDEPFRFFDAIEEDLWEKSTVITKH